MKKAYKKHEKKKRKIEKGEKVEQSMLRAEDVLIAISAMACGTSGLCYVKNKGDKKCRDKVYRLWHLGMVGMGTAFALMLYYLVNHYFEFSYVYEHTSLDLPSMYCISALWAGKEGSFLLWGLILVLMGYSVLRISYIEQEESHIKEQDVSNNAIKNKNRGAKRTFPTYVAITIAILIMCFIMRPFKLLETLPADGQGLSKALQDPWMVVHPPLVFVGYTAMAIMFALGMNDLNSGRYEAIIKNWARKSMLFLGLGIMTGSVWAYRALGWGGYWAWDPIENIALVPWLLLCAYIHGSRTMKDYEDGNFAYTRCRVNWTKDKCMLPFTIAVFGTFLVRSGLLKNASVHAYVGEMAKGRFIILGVFVILIGSIICLTCIRQIRNKTIIRFTTGQIQQDMKHRSKKKHALSQQKVLSQEDYKACFRLITYIYAYTILMGTISPLFMKVQVPNHFYNKLTIGYVVVNSLLILGIERENIGKKLGIALTLGAVMSVAMARYFDYRSVGLTLVLWIVLIPLLGYLLTGIKRRRRYYYWTHLLLLVMLVGGITSAGMSGQFMTTIGEEAPSGILSRLLEDRIVEQRQGVNPYEDENMVLYTTKPLINLFWIGSFGLLGVMVIENARERDILKIK